MTSFKLLGLLLLLLSVPVLASDISDAIERGDTSAVKALLTARPDALNSPDQNGLTPLNLAAYKGNTAIVEYLLARGADWKIGDNEGSLPIHNAAAAGQTGVVELLLAKGSDINAKDNNGETPLLFAISFRRFETANGLLDKGADPKTSNARGVTPLHHAVARGNAELCRRLIELGADVNARAADGSAPMNLAFQSRNAEIAVLLVEHGADTETRDGYGRTPLLLVARELGSVELATFLLEHGADINAQDRFGDTPLNLAAWRGFRGLVDLFLDRGAALPSNPQQRDMVAASCAQRGLGRLLNLLIEAGTDVTQKNGAGTGFLHAAAVGGSREVCGLLLDKGLPVNEQDIYGRTPLHYAAERGRTQACDLLISRGATVNVKSRAGHTPYNLAQEFGNDSTANLLRERGSSTAPPAFPKLQGPYFGQKLSGGQSELFAPDIVSSSRFKHGSVTFSPDGLEAYWASEYTFNDSGYSVGGTLTSKVENDTWTLPKLASYSTVGNNDDVPFFSPDGNHLYFLSRRPEQPGGQKGAERIWYMDRISGGWSSPQLINGGPNSHTLHWQFSVAANGNIYFSSEDRRGLGEGDIWVSRYANGSWAPPEPLGADVNSPGLEMCPFIAPDESYLIITTEGRPDGAGGPDFYISFLTPDGKWTKPITLGPTVNTPADEICPNVTSDGKYLFFNSNRGGESDIYWTSAALIDSLRKAQTK